ncbi:uncharacterized protein N7483_003971 [Penicillium malachiteum]|uniref:uncharacterized protein n=1 Tax=Penicillium malachiteum TaxID=1324776 RepID=UPI0025498780|nr:uncharacterized protein N7483_003971 [Penicillium malachiteum]KAJ5729463.1 hypothetical protein N7483_003971 [Penicillium malachiteum]
MTQTVVETDAAQSPKDFHIFGCGISFSVSPTIHNAGFRHLNVPYNYDIQESASIDDVAGLIANERFGGASVTMPHKLHVHKFCKEQTDTARLIGAINTLVVRSSGNQRVIIGDNTDWSGLYSIITNYAEGMKGDRSPKVGLVIGAGGASRAALYSMYRSGLQQTYVVNRTQANAEQIKANFAETFNIIVLASLQDLPCLPDIIIGTVPADVTTEEQFSSIFKTEGLCIDMAYKPRQTPLLTAAQRNKGWSTVTGLEVLLAQAYDQFRLWTDLEAPVEEMKEAVALHEIEKERKAVSNIL